MRVAFVSDLTPRQADSLLITLTRSSIIHNFLRNYHGVTTPFRKSDVGIFTNLER